MLPLHQNKQISPVANGQFSIGTVIQLSSAIIGNGSPCIADDQPVLRIELDEYAPGHIFQFHLLPGLTAISCFEQGARIAGFETIRTDPGGIRIERLDIPGDAPRASSTS